MKKNNWVVLLVLILMLTACGNNDEPNPKNGNSSTSNQDTGESSESIEEAPLDLAGNWEQKGKGLDFSAQAGYISGDRIELYWIAEDGSSNLYWSGTYEVPKVVNSEHSWSSKNDKTRTDTALLASGSEQKTFTYKDGELSYEASATGQTTTIILIPSKTDFMNLNTVTESADTSNLQEVEMIVSDYYVSQNDGSVTVDYIVGLKNPNDEYAIVFPEINITARDKDGKILKTETMTLMGIAAGDEYPYVNRIYYEGVLPSTVDISVENGDNDYRAQSSSGILYFEELPVTNISANWGTFDINFTGEVTNNSTEKLDNVSILVYYKSGEKAETEGTYISDLDPGETKPFEVSANTKFDSIDDYIIWAIQW